MKKTLPYIGIVGLCLGVATTASADRHQSEPVGQTYFSNVSEAELENLISEGFRLHDIEVVDTSPMRYAGSMVKNAGPYQEAWYWTANKTASELEDFYRSRNARMLDVEVNVVNGQRRFAGTFVRIEGRDASGWSWFDNKSFEEVDQLAAARDSRVIDIEVIQTGSTRRFTGVMVKNTGPSKRDSWVFSNLTSAGVRDLIRDRGARLIDIERIGEGRYAGVVEKSGARWWYKLDQSWEQLKLDVAQYGARVIDIERNVSGGKSEFNYILINNSNALETRIGELLRDQNNGSRGFMLKQMGGPTKGGLMEDFQFYPASAIKALQHFYWSYRIDKFGVNPQAPVPLYTDDGSDTHPQNGSTIQSNPFLRTVMQQSMIPSNNQNANALQDFAGNGLGVPGRAAMNNFAKSILGLNDDMKLNHKFGIGGVNSDNPNISSARQFCKLYEKAADGSVLSPGGWMFFRQNMLNETSNNGFDSGVSGIITQEANSLGKSAAVRNAFTAQIQLAWKGGNVNKHVASAGWIRLPYQTPSGIQFRQFTLCAFVHDATEINSNLSGNILPEILREEIRAALATW